MLRSHKTAEDTDVQIIIIMHSILLCMHKIAPLMLFGNLLNVQSIYLTFLLSAVKLPEFFGDEQ